MHDFTGFLELARQRNHNAARLLGAYDWKILAIEPGKLKLECQLPAEVLNLGGSLFGGFTPTYVDLISIWTCMTTLGGEFAWLSTVRLEVNYFEPIIAGFRVEAIVRNVRKRDYLVETAFRDDDGKLLALGMTTLRKSHDKRLPLHDGS
jgi:uncharacterized protein (TIGR00369 family)